MLKMADITPVHKKDSTSAKNNYRQGLTWQLGNLYITILKIVFKEQK